jgi:hypothetical protein
MVFLTTNENLSCLLSELRGDNEFVGFFAGASDGGEKLVKAKGRLSFSRLPFLKKLFGAIRNVH